MNKYKALAIAFALLTFGAIQESFRILTSNDADIVENRTWLMPMAFILPSLFLYLAIRYWRKAAKNKIR